MIIQYGPAPDPLQEGSRVAFFDFDHTLVCPKDARRFPRDEKDWTWAFPNVKDKLLELNKQGVRLYLATNQTKEWKLNMIDEVCKDIGVPITACIAFDKAEHKPSRALFDAALSPQEQALIDRADSFMCGDALGRRNDFADTDLRFAVAVGLPCLSPEKMFSATPDTPCEAASSSGQDPPLTSPQQEVVIMVGPPGSGKSTIAAKLAKNGRYFIASGDRLKTPERMLRAAAKQAVEGASIVFDATNPGSKRRGLFVSFARTYSLPVRCLFVSTPIDTARMRNLTRAQEEGTSPVPTIAYSVYKKKFEAPDESEGFALVIV